VGRTSLLLAILAAGGMLAGCRYAGMAGQPTPTEISSASASQSAGQSVAPSPSLLASPSVSPSVEPMDTARPTVPQREGPPTAVAEGDGIVLELWVPDEPATIGQWFFSHLRLTNESRGVVLIDYPCDQIAVKLDASSLVPPGRAWTGLAAAFKEQLLARYEHGNWTMVESQSIGREQRACGDVAGPMSPGGVVEQTYALDLTGTRHAGAVRPGPASVVATFKTYDWSEGDPPTITTDAPIRIEGVPTTETSIVGYIDRALEEKRFTDWLAKEPLDSWINTHISWWPNEEGQYPPDPLYRKATEGTVGIGLFRIGPNLEELGAVIFDLPSGKLLGFRFNDEYEEVGAG
jgi:hypothetical protein